jgi:hypothetical protein
MYRSTLTTTALLGILMTYGCGSPQGESDDGAGVTTAITTTSGTDDTTTSTGDDAETGEDSSDSGSSGGIIPDGGPGGMCGTECDIWAEDDCPTGEKCTSVACEIGSNSWDSNRCRPIQGSAAAGDECMYTDGSGVSGNDTCGEGSMCWNADADTGLGVCIAFCEGSQESPTCASGTFCAILNEGTLPICLPGCDPLAQDCEGANEMCLPDPSGQGYICALDASGDMAPYGTPCNYANVCNPGLLCVNPAGVPEAECASAGGCCSPMCSISAGEACPGTGQTCEPVFESQPPGFEDVGVCTIAM